MPGTIQGDIRTGFNTSITGFSDKIKMNSQDKLKIMFWRRAFSALIDVIFIYCIGYLAHILIMRWIFLEPFIAFALIWFLYYTLCYCLFDGKTFARAVTGLQVVNSTNERAGIRQIAFREVVCKFILLLIIPSFVIYRLHFYTKTQVIVTGMIILLLIMVMLVFFLIYRRPWWELASSTKTIRNHKPVRIFRLFSFMAIAGIFILTIYIKFSCYLNDWEHFKTRFLPEYPVNDESRRYAGFIATHSRNPVEYVFDLFEKYDLVVLDERLHPEYTQYELISKIVSDPRFARKIGNIYTEFGSQNSQDILTRYLNTVFPDEDTLNKATAWLQNNSCSLWPSWGYTNVFDFLKFVNKINALSPDSLKINWYCTDIPVDWPKMTRSKFLNLPRKAKRDKIMADRITAIYKSKITKNVCRKKGLVIMNQWHGFGLIRNRNGEKADHFLNTYCATAILMDSLPGKVCNVLINTIPFGVYGTIFGPIRYGKWDKAFEMAGNPEAGFNFESSPFGSDNFDCFLWNSSSELLYRDVFTGFIFYKPLEQHVQKVGFPFMLYHFEDTLLRRSACLGETYAETVHDQIIRKTPDLNKTVSQDILYAVDYNFAVNIGVPFIIAVTLIICSIYYIATLKEVIELIFFRTLP